MSFVTYLVQVKSYEQEKVGLLLNLTIYWFKILFYH